MFMRILSRSRTSSQLAQEQEKEQVRKLIETDLKTVDLKISLYIAACGELPLSEIHPSPPVISSESNRIENASLLTVNDCIPPPESLLALLKHPDGQVLSTKTYGVLKWLTVGLKEPKISYVQPQRYGDILKLGALEDQRGPEPEAVFSLKPHCMSRLDQAWTVRAVDEETNHAFLPCKVEYLHCLLYKGRVSKAPETDGSLVLYTNHKYCVEIAPAAWTWGKSTLGIKLKVVALVEFVDSIMNVKSEETAVTHAQMGRITLKNYRLVDSMYCRIRYLLVYPQEKRHHLMTQPVPAKRSIMQNTMILTWAFVICLAYVLPSLKMAEKDPY